MVLLLLRIITCVDSFTNYIYRGKLGVLLGYTNYDIRKTSTPLPPRVSDSLNEFKDTILDREVLRLRQTD